MKLYVYDHCPFCAKARMIFGLKSVPLELSFLLEDDVDTPTSLVGKKTTPILQKNDGSHTAESMDIVHYIDSGYGQPLVSPLARIVLYSDGMTKRGVPSLILQSLGWLSLICQSLRRLKHERRLEFDRPRTLGILTNC